MVCAVCRDTASRCQRLLGGEGARGLYSLRSPQVMWRSVVYRVAARCTALQRFVPRCSALYRVAARGARCARRRYFKNDDAWDNPLAKYEDIRPFEPLSAELCAALGIVRRRRSDPKWAANRSFSVRMSSCIAKSSRACVLQSGLHDAARSVCALSGVLTVIPQGSGVLSGTDAVLTDSAGRDGPRGGRAQRLARLGSGGSGAVPCRTRARLRRT